MKSHEAKRHEAWQLIAWVGGGVTILLVLLVVLEGTVTWRGVFAIMGLITELTGVVLFSWGLLTQPVGWFRLWNLPAGHKEFWH